MQDYVISEQAVEAARSLGMFGNIEDRVRKMAQNSAPFTHPDGNRRFEGYVLLVDDDGVVTGLAKLRTRIAPPSRHKAVSERVGAEAPTTHGELVVCPDCENDGGPCATCNSTGFVTKVVANSLIV